jgi:hypothetical protein
MKTKLLLFFIILTAHFGWGQYSITATGSGNTYTQNFNSFAGTSATLPTNWAVATASYNATFPILTSGTATPTVANASGNNCYSGRSGSSSSDYCILQKQATSGSTTFTFSATNGTGSSINGFTITWKAKQYSAAGRASTVDFKYRTNGGSYVSTGITGTTLYTSSTGSSTTFSESSTAYSITITGLTLTNTQTVDFQFSVANGAGSGSNAHVGIDDFTMYANATASSNDTTSAVSGPLSAAQPNPGGISSLATSAATAVRVFDFNVFDYATTDFLPTKINQITIKAGAANTSNWFNTIAGLKLSTNGGITYITTGTPIITTNTITIPIVSGNLDIPSAGSATVSLYIYLKNTSLTDYDTFEFIIPATGHGFIADAAGSSFATTFASSATSKTVLIDVAATQLVFSQQPTNTATNSVMSPAVSIKATDVNLNTDKDFISNIKITSSGTLSTSPVIATAVNGIATFNSLSHTITGTNLILTAKRNISDDWSVNSSIFDITTPAPIATPANNITQTQFNANWNSVIGATDYKLDAFYYTNLLTEGFETALPANWHASSWTRSTSASDLGSGVGAAIAASNNGDLTTAAVSNPQFLSFYLGRSSNNTTAKTLNIQVSTTSQTTGFVTIATFDHTNVPVSSYYKYTVDLSAYASQPIVYIRFNKVSSTTSPWRIDDVSISGTTLTYVSGYQDLSVGNVLTKTVNGLTADTQYFFRVRSVNGATSPNSNIINLFTKPVLCTWKGTYWTNNSGPDSDIDAIIQSNFIYPTNGAFTAKNLTVATGGALTVNSGSTITLADAITNNLTADKVVFENGASLLQTNSAASNLGNITYKRTTSALTNNNDFVYIGSPVFNPTLGSAWMTSANDTFYSFNNAAIPQDWAYAAPSTQMAAGVGYIARTKIGSTGWTTLGSAYNINFIGKPNNGNVPVTLINNGSTNIDNLISNPYPSAIDIALFRNDLDNKDFLTGNFYFWTHNTALDGSNNYQASDYAILNVALGASVATSPSGATPLSLQYVAAGQGFFAEAAGSGGIATFKNAHRVASNNTNNFYRTTSGNNGAASDKLWLNLSNNTGLFKQQLVAYTQNATIAYDQNYDAKSFEGNIDIDFYSIIPTKKLAIQSRPNFTTSDLVELGYKASVSGNYTIAIDHSDGLFENRQAVFLQDNLLGLDYDLTTAPYNFSTAAGTFDNRFILKYSSALATTDHDYLNNSVSVAFDNKDLKIKSVSEDIKSVAIFDLLGRKVYFKNNISAKDFIASKLSMSNQTMIIKIELSSAAIITRKMLF